MGKSFADTISMVAASLDAGIVVTQGVLYDSNIGLLGSRDKAVVNGRHPAALSKPLRQPLHMIKTCVNTTVYELTLDYR